MQRSVIRNVGSISKCSPKRGWMLVRHHVSRGYSLFMYTIYYHHYPNPKKQNRRKTSHGKNPREVVNVTNKRFFFLGLALFAENVSKLRDVGNNLGIIKGFQPCFSVHQTSCLSSN